MRSLLKSKSRTGLGIVQILIASLFISIPIQINGSSSASAIGSCDSNGSVVETTAGGFVTVKYTLTSSANNAGSSSSCTYTVPAGVTQVEFLVVGGGGGGGGDYGGGGGAGGLLHYKNFITTPGASLNLSVGSGGAGSASSGSNGSGSSFAGKSVGGGGGGGSGRYGLTSSGGSGGGGSRNQGGSSASTPAGIFPNTFFANGGGGGSASRAGGGGGASQTGNEFGGGNGYAFAGTTYADGGGGGAPSGVLSYGGSGSSGSGGVGGGLYGGAGEGINGRGSGGGGGNSSGSGGRGGGGVVIVRYQICTFSSPTNYSTGVGSNYKFLVRATTSDSNSSCTGNWSAPTGVTEVEVFVLGGGGGGGGKLGGGGGSGGAILQSSYSIGSDTTIAVTVGGGGHGGYGGINDSAGYGGNSTFGSLIAYGGGYGGDEVAGVRSGRNGGSGGGANGGAGGNGAIGTATQAFGTGTKYGSNGGYGSGITTAFGAGGGGGLGGSGGSGSSTNGGAGGLGITRYGVNLGGGGGGGVDSGTAGTAATYGGGAGSSSGNGSNATASTGGGGGGGRNSTTAYGGNGGSGTIFILYHQNLSITFNANGGVDTPTAQSFQSGVAFNLTNSAPTRAGYVFKRWNTQVNKSGMDYESGSSNLLSTNLTLYADWEASVYTVNYVYNGATRNADVLSSNYTTGNSAITLPSPLKSDYVLAGWYLEADFKTFIGFAASSYAPNTTSTSITLYANWVQYTYTFTFFDANSGSGGGADGGTEPAKQNGTSITSVTLSANTLALSGYTFAGWATSNGSTSVAYADSATINITSNTTLNLYPVWSADTYTVTYNYNGATSGNGTSSSTYLSGGTAITLPTPVKTGYTFSGWYSDSGLTSSIGSAGANYLPTGSTKSLMAYAKWSANKIDVSFNSQGGSSGGKAEVFVGGELSEPTAPTRAGFTFDGWSTTSNGSVISFNPTYTVNQTNNFTLYAIWSAVVANFTVTFNSDGGTGSMAPQVASTATNLTLNTFTRTGYSFAGWNTEPFGKGTPYANGASYAFTSDTTLYATWTYSGYVVSFDAQGGTAVDQVLLNNGSSISLPTQPTKSGSTFSGWSLTGSGSIISFPYTPATFSDLTLYAIWSTAAFTVTFDSNGGTPVSSESATVGSTITEPTAPTRSGYVFGGWTTKDGDPAVTFPYLHGASSNFTLYAIWINSYTVTFDPQGGDSVSPIIVPLGSSTSAPTPPTKVNYTFNGWWTEVIGGTQILFPYTPSGNITLRARWVANFFTVVFDSQGGSILDSLQLSANSLIDTPTASIRSGYRLLGWSLDKSENSVVFPYNPNNAPTELYAIWQLIPNSTVTFDSNGGSGSMSAQTANTARSLTINSYTRSGYSFAGWNTQSNGGGTEYLDSATYAFNADITLYAIWTPITLSVTFDSQSGSSVTGATVGINETLTAPTAPTRLGYNFLGWSTTSNGTVINFPYTHGQSINFTLYARWSEITFTVTYTAPDAGSGSVPTDSSSPYVSGSVISLASNSGSLTKSGYGFAGWKTADDASLRIAGSSFTVMADVTFIAVWTQIYQLSFNSNGGSGSMVTLDGPTVTIPSNTFNRSGYIFSAWNTQADGLGTNVSVGITVPLVQSVTLYAIWTAVSGNIITFNTISTQNYGASVDISTYVSASSGLSVSVISNSPNICSITGMTLTAISVGSCSVTASQAGDATTEVANNVTSSFSVSKKSLSITVGSISSNYGSSYADPTYTQSGLVTARGDSITTPIFYYSGTSSTYYAKSTRKPTAVGSYEITITTISLSPGSISNYQLSIVAGSLVISSVASNSLSALSIKGASGSITTELLTNFNNSTTAYSIYVGPTVSGIISTISRASSSVNSVQVKINDSGWRRLSFQSNVASSGLIALPTATNTFLIKLTTSDKGTKQFTVTIYRDTLTAPTGGSVASPAPSAPATSASAALSAVTLSANGFSVPLSTTFSNSTYSYSASFTNTQNTAVMSSTFTAVGINIKLKINNGPFLNIAAAGSSSSIPLIVGNNSAILRVTSSNGTTADYTFTLTRAAALTGLTPTFGSPTSTSDGFTVQISNHSATYSWGVSATNGSASIDNSGLITVTGLSGSTTLNVVSRRSGYANASASFTYP